MHRSSALPENTKMASLNAEVIRRMQNTSEILPDAERVVVIDNFSQKLANSGYPLEQIRRIVVGGLSGYEKRLRQSKMEIGKGWRPLHESAKASCTARMNKK